MGDMHVDSCLLAREEEQAKLAVANNRGCHEGL
jgi:hypothetical protein